MNTVLYFSPNDVVYETRAFSRADISELVLDRGLESLNSADRQFDFWFSPTTERCQRAVNLSATELLLATAKFTAKTVPLLRGGVVVATHDSDGNLDGLSWQQLDLLAKSAHTLGRRDSRILQRRIGRTGHPQRRSRIPHEVASATPSAPHPTRH